MRARVAKVMAVASLRMGVSSNWRRTWPLPAGTRTVMRPSSPRVAMGSSSRVSPLSGVEKVGVPARIVKDVEGQQHGALGRVLDQLAVDAKLDGLGIGPAARLAGLAVQVVIVDAGGEGLAGDVEISQGRPGGDLAHPGGGAGHLVGRLLEAHQAGQGDLLL